MGIHAIKLPDVGEGVAEAELVEWTVKIGDIVRSDEILGAVMTDKATVEIPSSVDGTVTWLCGEIGDTLAVGSDFVHIEVLGEGNRKADATPAKPAPKIEASSPATNATPTPAKEPEPKPTPVVKPTPAPSAGPIRAAGEKPLAAPSVRQRARDAGIDLRRVRGTGPAGRITHSDIDAYEAGEATPVAHNGAVANTSVNEVKLVGLRRKIAERMALAKQHIPHITIVEEVDVTALEELRARLNAEHAKTRAKLTVLPFIMRVLVKAVQDQPALNALFDDENGVIRQHGGVHIGIATQTPDGLKVPVAFHAETRSLWECATEIGRLSESARDGTIGREELSGSTITITSLGPLGAIATTPIINYPEVAIVGVNKIAVRPVWEDGEFVPRKIMNLSCSFDHRVIDGWDAAIFVQRLKNLLETPAMMFIEG